MLFIEPQFVILVTACWLTFFLVPVRFRPHVLTSWGIAFYALYALPWLLLVVALVLLTYFFHGRHRKWVVVTVCAGLLAYFKQPGAVSDMAGTGVTALRAGGPLVPLGFSFLAFELMHYAIDRGRGRIKNASLPDLAAFAFFFPCRVAGPIKRFNDFTASVARAERSPDDVYRGCVRILSGLFKKVALADTLGRAASGLPAAATPLQAWQSVLAYSFALYFDFSGYSDMAIGVSRLMGIRVPENFNWPYLSSNIEDFWNRWHMSLSSWARDYIFMSAGRELFKTGLRARAGLIAAASYVITFLGIGAWHGLSANFLVWGAYHGLLVTAFHFYKTSLPERIVTSRFYESRAVLWGSTLLTFFLVTIGWVFFRTDLPNAARVLALMFGRMTGNGNW